MNEALISIIVPIYNKASFLPKCLNSIQAQTYTNLDVVLINDGSLDQSESICREYTEKDSRFHLYSQINQGISVARNNGLKYAKGDLISFIDSDDYVSERYIEILYKCLTDNDADISIAAYKKVHSGENPDFVQNDINLILNGREAVLRQFEPDGLNYIFNWCKLYKRELFHDIKYPAGRVMEDSAVCYIIFDRAKKVVENSSVVYAYYQNSESITAQKFNRNRLDALLNCKERCAYFLEKKDIELAALSERDYYNRLLRAKAIVCDKMTGHEKAQVISDINRMIKSEYPNVLKLNCQDHLSAKNKMDKILKETIGRFFFPIYTRTFNGWDGDFI